MAEYRILVHNRWGGRLLVLMQPYMQWVVAVLMIGAVLSVVSRFLPHSYQSSVQRAILVGGIFSICLFPLSTLYQLESGHLMLGCFLISGLFTPEGPVNRLHRLIRQLRGRSSRQTPSKHSLLEEHFPLASGPEAGAATTPERSLTTLKRVTDDLPEDLVPAEARLELSWLYLEQGDLASSLEQVRLGLAHSILLDATETDALRSWLRYLHCYQAILMEGAYHVNHERTGDELKQLAWRRYQTREMFWRS